jgi:hypothetical protein
LVKTSSKSAHFASAICSRAAFSEGVSTVTDRCLR